LGYALAWTEDGWPTAVSHAVIEGLVAAASKGLDPEDYDGPCWSSRLLELQKHHASPRDLARFDLSLTISTMRYVSDLCAGRVNPRLLHPDFRLTHDSPDPATFVRERLLPADNPGLVLEESGTAVRWLSPNEKALHLYRELAGQDTNQPLPPLRKPLEPGDSYSGIKRSTEILHLVGDLPGDAVVPAQLDVAKVAL
jgi:L,D-transpeptidase YcbB